MPEVNEDLSVVGGKFLDTAEGNEDFFAFWYSTVYTVGMINTYRNVIANIRGNEMMIRRFLTSKGVYFSKVSSLDTLQYLFDNWIKEIQHRGTGLISSPQGRSEMIGLDGEVITGIIANDVLRNSGMGISGDKLIQLDETFSVGNIYSFEFDFIMKPNGGAQKSFNSYMFENMELLYGWLNISTTGIVTLGKITLDLLYNKSNHNIVLPSIEVPVDGKNHFKLLTIKDTTYIYLNGDLVSTTTHLGYSATYSLDSLSNGVIPVIANVKVVGYDPSLVPINVYIWTCNEGSGCWLNCLGIDKPFRLGAVPTDSWGDIWIKEPEFKNVNYTPVDGELRRLLSTQEDEMIFELADQTETGLTVNKSSFLSEEASMVNLNKSYERGDVNRLSNYPLDFFSVYPKKANGYISFITEGADNHSGINVPLLTNPDWKTNAFYKPLGLIPFIPIIVAGLGDNIEGYEVSFVIKLNTGCTITFGILGYDADFNYLPNVFKDYAGNVTNLFIDNASLSEYQNMDVIIRGVYSPEKLEKVSPNINIQELGVNLYTPYGGAAVKYIVPVIRVTCTLASVINFKDIIVRPLVVNTIKGIVGGKNQMFGYMKNRSGELQKDVLVKIQDDLIPYNCTTNIKFI